MALRIRHSWFTIAAGVAVMLLSTATPTAVPAPPVMSPPQVAGDTVTLSWTVPFGTTGIRLEAGTAPGLSNAANTVLGPIAGYTATRVPSGIYYVRVRAIDAFGDSAPSNEVTVVVGGPTGCSTRPGAPILQTPVVHGNIVSFTWTPASSVCPATSFELHGGSAPGQSNLAIVNVGSVLGFEATAPDGTYYVRVLARNPSGLSVPSNDVVVTVGSAGTITCSGAADPDVFGSTIFVDRHPVGVKPWGCVIASSRSGARVFDGSHSARFEVRAEDCTASFGFDDCSNDRSRHEIEETTPPAHPPGAVVRYETHLYVPSQVRFQPAGQNLMFLSQIRFSSPSAIGNIAYLELGPNYELIVQTTVGATSQTHRRYSAGRLLFDRWFQVDWEVKATSQPDGFIRAYVDGVLVADETRPTLPEPSGYAFLALGVYNAFKSRATEPYATQVMYADGIRKSFQ